MIHPGSELLITENKIWMFFFFVLHPLGGGLQGRDGLGSYSSPQRQSQVGDGQDNSRFGQSRQLHQLRNLDAQKRQISFFFFLRNVHHVAQGKF